MRTIPKTLGALGLLTAALPVNLCLTAVALTRRALRTPDARHHRSDTLSAGSRTILLSGGKMTKALQLARSFHDAGNRVIMVEQAKYRFTGHRYSRAVAAFYTVPKPQSPDYAQALLDIVRRENVDVYVPVCSPAASYYDALAAPLLAPYCEVLHCDAEMIATLDDKFAFTELAASLGLPVPDSHRVTAPEQVIDALADRSRSYILKSIPYDPVHRLDLTPLPRPSVAQTEAFARSKPMTEQQPWVLQELLTGREYCVHTTVRDGELAVYCCCPSSAFQLNYESADKPEIEKWVRGFVEPLGLTGQISFDLIETDDGRVLPIECNPRTHSAITMFYDHPGLAAAYLDDDAPPVHAPMPGARPTYWIYQELWRLATRPRALLTTLRTIVRGKDAIFSWDDPLPFLLVHHLQIPSLLIGNLLHNRPWTRIDVNIGKLVEPGGD